MILASKGCIDWGLPGEVPETQSKLIQLYKLKDAPDELQNLEETHPEIINEPVDELAVALRDECTTPEAK